MRYLPVIAYLALVTYAIADLVQRPGRTQYGLSKWMWAAIIILLPLIGAITWIYLSRTRPDGGSTRQARPVAPDDDPEYLAWLREQSRRRKQTGEGK